MQERVMKKGIDKYISKYKPAWVVLDKQEQ